MDWKDVSTVGMGTWKMRDADAMQAALEAGLDAGLNHIDTAELYTGSEEAIAPVIAGRRSEVFLVSKVMPKNATHEGTVRHCDATRERLGTEYLDAYLLHWVGDIPIENTMAGMADLVDAGKVKHVGVSNHDVAELEAAQDALGGIPLSCNQVIWHPRERRVENEVLPWCQKNGVAVVGYSGFGSGNLVQTKDWATLESIGAPHGKTAAQVTLDALSRHPMTFHIPKSENPGHVRENAAAVATRLPSDAYEAFDAAFPAEAGGLWRF